MQTRRSFLTRLLATLPAVSLAQQGGFGSTPSNHLVDNDLWTFTPPIPDDRFWWFDLRDGPNWVKPFPSKHFPPESA